MDRDREGEKIAAPSGHYPPPEPAFQSSLTVIWAEEKAELLRRISALEEELHRLQRDLDDARINIQAHAAQVAKLEGFATTVTDGRYAL